METSHQCERCLFRHLGTFICFSGMLLLLPMQHSARFMWLIICRNQSGREKYGFKCHFVKQSIIMALTQLQITFVPLILNIKQTCQCKFVFRNVCRNTKVILPLCSFQLHCNGACFLGINFISPQKLNCQISHTAVQLH